MTVRVIGFSVTRKGPWESWVAFHNRPAPKSFCAMVFETGRVWVNGAGYRDNVVDPQTVQALIGALP